MCPPTVLQRTPGKARRPQVPRRTQRSESSDDDRHPELAIEKIPPRAEAELDIIADATISESDGSIADDSGTDNKLSARPVRRSTRSTARHHSN